MGLFDFLRKVRKKDDPTVKLDSQITTLICHSFRTSFFVILFCSLPLEKFMKSSQ